MSNHHRQRSVYYDDVYYDEEEEEEDEFDLSGENLTPTTASFMYRRDDSQQASLASFISPAPAEPRGFFGAGGGSSTSSKQAGSAWGGSGRDAGPAATSPWPVSAPRDGATAAVPTAGHWGAQQVTSVVSSHSVGTNASISPPQVPTVAAHDVEAVEEVVGDAFSVTEIKRALMAAAGDVDAAINVLLEGVPDDDTAPSAAAPVARPLARPPVTVKKPGVARTISLTAEGTVAHEPSGLALNLAPDMGPGVSAKDAAALIAAAGATTAGGVEPFRFDAPSPDEAAIADRTQRFKAARKEAEPGKISTPSSKAVASRSGVADGGVASTLTPTLSSASSRNIAVMRQDAQRSKDVVDAMQRHVERRPKLSMVVIGHVDAGKSTLMGHLLHALGHVTDRAMHRHRQDSERVGKGSFAFAWVMDAHEEERRRGITMDVAVNRFATPHRSITLLDAPGHRDFVPNMIQGAAQADCAVLVLNASPGEFESGFADGGQSKEHALLARSLGVRQLIVAVNKMDTVDWAEARFRSIEAQARAFLASSGFWMNGVRFIPVSGISGENLVARAAPQLCAWYSGQTLIEMIDTFDVPVRLVDKPFRMAVSDVYRSQAQGMSLAVGGKIEAGRVALGDRLFVAPTGELVVVKAVQRHDDAAGSATTTGGVGDEDGALAVDEDDAAAGASQHWAQAGDNVDLGLAGVDASVIAQGHILCDPSNPIPVVSRFIAKILVFATLKIPILKGSQCVLHMQSVDEPVHFVKLRAVLHSTTGEVVKRKPRALTKGVTAEVELETSRAVCLERYADYKQLGRFTLRSGSDSIAAGVVVDFVLKR